MSEAAVLVTGVGGATGSRAAAAALACAGSEPDLAGLLVDLGGGGAPRPALLASAAARELEERLAAHLPEAPAASRGWTCHLTLPRGPEGVERLPAALALARDSVAVVHLPPRLFRPALEAPGVRACCALLRADRGADRPLAALLAGELSGEGVRVAVLARPLGRVASRRALAGLLPGGAAGGLPEPLRRRLLAAHRASVTQSFD